MNITTRKNIAIMLMLIFVIAGSAGCLGGNEESKSKVKYEDVTGSRTLSGWAQMDQDTGTNGDSTLEESIEMNLNSSMMTHVKVTVTVQDSDAAHSDTDEGSDPDEFSIKINSSGIDSNPVSGVTPQTVEVMIPTDDPNATGDDPVQFGPELTIQITANCRGGKPAHLFRPGVIISASPLVYIDQGLAYAIDIEYVYSEQV